VLHISPKKQRNATSQSLIGQQT